MFKNYTVCFALVAVVVGNTACSPEKQEIPTAPPSSDSEKGSYAIGEQIGTNIKERFGESIDGPSLIRGINDAITDSEPALSADEMVRARNQMIEQVQEKMRSGQAQTEQDGREFLKNNATRPEITVTESGLQYEVLISGDSSGVQPKPTDTVVTHYHGTLIDGTVFDSSVQRGVPAEFGLNRVITGWTEALQLMRPGDKYKLFLPPELAYGERSPSEKIGPNATLIFEVELLEVK